MAMREFPDVKASERSKRDSVADTSVFLDNLTRELQRSLSPLAHALERWPRGAADPEELEQLRDVVERETRHLDRLTHDVTDMSQILDGSLVLNQQPVDLGAALAAAIEGMRPSIDASAHRLTLTRDEDPIFVRGDEVRLTQVFSNILHNAAKFAVRNGTIAVRLEKRASQAVVTIEDNGPGIPVAMLSGIFDAFRRADSPLSCFHDGLGVGLWLARRLAELHGGTIIASSGGPGKGSQFVVALPVLETSRAVPAMQGAASLAAHGHSVVTE
jgi:signal transduction histidine kinase